MRPLIFYYDMLKTSLSALIEKSEATHKSSVTTYGSKYNYDRMRASNVGLRCLGPVDKSRYTEHVTRLNAIAAALCILFEREFLQLALAFPHEYLHAGNPLIDPASMNDDARTAFLTSLDESPQLSFGGSGQLLDATTCRHLLWILAGRENRLWVEKLPSGRLFYQQLDIGLARCCNPLPKWTIDLGFISSKLPTSLIISTS